MKMSPLLILFIISHLVVVVYMCVCEGGGRQIDTGESYGTQGEGVLHCVYIKYIKMQILLYETSSQY